MHFPVELVHEILSHLPIDDKQSFRSCSMVAKSWVDPSQQRLFALVTISPKNYRSWSNNISPENTRLLGHVRSLTHLLGGKHQGSHIDDDLRDYLPSFCQLQRLVFNLEDIKPTIPVPESFSVFQHTLTSLFFVTVSIPLSGFVSLVGYFPNLEDLLIRGVTFTVDDRPVPHLSRPLRGRLSVILARWDGADILIDQLPGLKPEYEELVMLERYEPRLVAVIKDSLKYLKVARSNYPPDLLHCPELRELEVAMIHPQKWEQILISSITSTNLQRITFSPLGPLAQETLLLDDPCWVPFDDMMCGLVDRLCMAGGADTLELEFRVKSVEPGEEAHLKEFLPKFKEKGVVRIGRVSSGDAMEYDWWGLRTRTNLPVRMSWIGC